MGALLGLLFVCLFWNGIVSIFIWGLYSGEMEGDMGVMGWWGMFVFLIPFEVIGLAMLAGFLVTLFDPFRRTSWSFGHNVIMHRIAYSGIGISWNYPAPTECSLEIHTDE